MEVERFIYKNNEFCVRENTSDTFVVKEVFEGNGTYRKLKIEEDDVILDIGANIGAFTIWAVQKGGKVIGFEPCEENYTLSLMNTDNNIIDYDRYELHNLAVIGNDDKTRKFYINKMKNKGAHSLVGKRGREEIDVSCINFNKILESYNPKIIKMDIEGGEYEIIKNCNDYKNVEQFILEFHHSHLNDLKDHKKFYEICDILEKHFDIVEGRRDTKGAWVSLIYCKNNAPITP